MSITHKQIINNTSNMTLDELCRLNSELVAIIKHRRKMESKDMRSVLSVGDKVWFEHGRSGKKITGKVTKIMRTKALVQEPMLATWKVPMSALSLV